MFLRHVTLVLLVAQTAAQCTIGYTGANASLWCTCNAGYTGRNFIAPYSTTACARFFAVITRTPSFATVLNRNSAGVGSLPTYFPTGGPRDKGYLFFDRSKSNWLTTGPTTFNAATNGGMTVIVLLKFIAPMLAFEAILTLQRTSSSIDFALKRDSNTDKLTVILYSSGAVAGYISASAVNLDPQWNLVVVQWQASTGQLTLGLNGAFNSAGSGWSDKTLTGIHVGKDWSGTKLINANVAGAFIVDEYLSTSAIAEIHNSMLYDQDMTSTTCPSGNECYPCAADTYKPTSGYTTCTACPTGFSSVVASTSVDTCDMILCEAGSWSAGASACTACMSGASSPARSTAAAACLCLPGHTGPDGGPCVTCTTGKYKIATGSAACLACHANSTSPAGSTAAASCVCDLGYQPGA